MSDQTFKEKLDKAVGARPDRASQLPGELAADALAADIGRALGENAAPASPAPPQAAPPPEAPPVDPFTRVEQEAIESRQDPKILKRLREEILKSGDRELWEHLDSSPADFIDAYDRVEAAAREELAHLPPKVAEMILAAKAKPPAPEAPTPDPAVERQKRLEQLRDRASISGTGQRDAEAELLSLLDERFRK